MKLYRLSLDELMKQAGYTKSKLQNLLGSAQARLLTHRAMRPAPAQDNKILTSWNALMIRGLAIAGGALQRPELCDAAGKAIAFIADNMIVDGRLTASYAQGKPRFNGYLDDYAFLLDAVIESLQRDWLTEHLQFAIWLADQLLERFEDSADGGFFFTEHEHEALPPVAG